MANKYSRVTNFGTETHFSQAVTGELAFSRMVSAPEHTTTFNAGDIVPIYCLEVLPHDTIDMSLDFVLRQTTARVPTMGTMNVDYYAFFVPNRVVNQSWKAVQGENFSGSWVAPQVSLAPLVGASSAASIQIPVGSVADYYGFPTQAPLPKTVLQQCHDLKFRGYVMIYNEFFRDQNYQPPIPMSTLNIYQGFLDIPASIVPIDGSGRVGVDASTVPDGSLGSGAVAHALYGSGRVDPSQVFYAGSAADSYSSLVLQRFRATQKPLKANKLHDYFTSVLPSPEKGMPVLLPLSGNAPVLTGSSNAALISSSSPALQWRNRFGSNISTGAYNITGRNTGSAQPVLDDTSTGDSDTGLNNISIVPDNLYADLSQVTSATLNDLRMAAAVQQVYEALARGGSRYCEFVRTLFGLEVDNPLEDIPTCLGHFRRQLDLFQTAQTSASGETPQGNLAAFGYTANSGHLFKQTFFEHGYIHVFAVVRHRNVYSSFLARDNFRLNMMDWYTPPLANISEQPVYAREVNPYVTNPDQVFGYQEAWAEYRYDPDYVSGFMRPGVSQSVDMWNYADNYTPELQIATGEWLKSNSEQVMNRTLTTTSDAPSGAVMQLYGQFRFNIDKERPLPTYSMPGLDIF